MKLKIKRKENDCYSIKLDNKEISSNVLIKVVKINSCEYQTIILEMAFEDLELESDVLPQGIEITERIFD